MSRPAHIQRFIDQWRKSHPTQDNIIFIGCDDCDRKPFSRNLCRRCYGRAYYYGVLDGYPTKAEAKRDRVAS